MTQETFFKAQDINDRICRLGGKINKAEHIKDEFTIEIVGRNPRGDCYILATLEKDDPLREHIANTLITRYKEEREKLKEQFNNL